MKEGEGIINALPQCVYLISVSAIMFTIRSFCSSIICGYNFPIADEEDCSIIISMGSPQPFSFL